MKRWLYLLFLGLAQALPLAAGPAAPLATVDLFVATDCPIANGYAPEIERLHQAYQAKGISFRLVFPDRDLTEETVRRHLDDYRLKVPFEIDRDHALVKRASATTTPEAVVFDPKGVILYQGRIDNRYSDLGDRRGTVTESTPSTPFSPGRDPPSRKPRRSVASSSELASTSRSGPG